MNASMLESIGPTLLPILHITQSTLPQVKSWKVKGKYKILLNVEQVSSHIIEFGPEQGKIAGDFRIVKAKDVTEEGPVGKRY